MKVVYIRDRSHKPAFIKKTTELLPYDLGAELIGALEQELSELDQIEMPDEQRARIREAM